MILKNVNDTRDYKESAVVKYNTGKDRKNGVKSTMQYKQC